MASEENRREALKKIGLALAATAASGTVGLPVEAQPQRSPKQFKIPQGVKSAVRGGGNFDVFVARNGDEASALVVEQNSPAAMELASSLKVQPAKATVINGVIHVGLGAASARGSVANQGAISFAGSRVSQNVLFVR